MDWSNLSTFQCIDCMQGKSREHRHTVGSRLKYQQIYLPFQYFHSDFFGPVPSNSIAEWFIFFTDESTKVKWGFLLKHKDEATITHIITSFIATIEH